MLSKKSTRERPGFAHERGLVDAPKYPRHYVPDDKVTIEWLQVVDTINTVLEFNQWPGEADRPEKEGEIEITRHAVLMETEHDAILRINRMLIEGDPRALRALRVATCMYGAPQTILGYDFKNDCPRVILTRF